MECEKCHKRPATVHYTEVVNGKKREMHLCATCAEEEGIGSFKITTHPFKFENLFGDLLGAELPRAAGEARENACRRCGLTERQFARLGRFGCSGCYDAFEPHLDALLRRVQGHLRHTGKVPARGQHKARRQREIDRLRRELQEAVQREEFERAAELRDKIRELEQRAD
ncbi:MAG: UvrB/UvrC motif-containing protein [Thermoanaerobacterales bacterium]|nr:UvrB/UvrC motif-containing protein [Bacillota bacterium]MDI6907543.1 UvrB/UvrC motif-containing protein [Thermoanaerobacterales bacterium]